MCSLLSPATVPVGEQCSNLNNSSADDPGVIFAVSCALSGEAEDD